MAPLATALVPPERAHLSETRYPLQASVCTDCCLLQLPEGGADESTRQACAQVSVRSPSSLGRAERYAASMARRLGLDATTQVVQVGSSDGYLLQYFARQGIPVLGVDPGAAVARAAMLRGVPTEIAHFTAAAARRLRACGWEPALVCAHNVLGHVPDLHDLAQGLRILLREGGVLTVEFPHLLQVILKGQFDAIHHEHLAHLSLLAAEMLFAPHGLVPFDVEEVGAHGGSLRIHVRHQEDRTKPVTEAVEAMRRREVEAGLAGTRIYRRFAEGIAATKCDLLDFLVGARRAGQRVVGYGAPARGNTLLNYCGVGPELLPFTADASPDRQGLLLPGTRIPVRAPSAITEARPDFVLILPWTLREEIAEQLSHIRSWGGRFVVPVPRIEIF